MFDKGGVALQSTGTRRRPGTEDHDGALGAGFSAALWPTGSCRPRSDVSQGKYNCAVAALGDLKHGGRFENATEDINGVNPFFHFAGLATNWSLPTEFRAGVVHQERAGLLHVRIPEMHRSAGLPS